MSDKYVIIADSIKYQPHLYGFDILMQATFRRLDMSQLLIYFVNTVNPAVLPILAQEFDLSGNKGWNFAVDEPAQRELLKKSIQLHRYMGTPWSIYQALQMVGITSGTIMENIGVVGDGCDWARFGVQIDTSIMTPTGAQITNATILINIFKNARSLFMGFTYI